MVGELTQETCSLDSGVLTFGPKPGEEIELRVIDDGWVGEGDVHPAPGGGYLCDILHHAPITDTADDPP